MKMVSCQDRFRSRAWLFAHILWHGIPGQPQSGEKQILSSYVLFDVLEPRRPADAVAVLALTTVDLWPGEGWNFVFGQASPNQRVGVWSLNRYGDAEKEYKTFLLRTLKVAVHETGHMLGIPHCVAYRCGMNGSNSQSEMDTTPLAFCPECAVKVWWRCDLEPGAWYRSLIGFAEQHKLDSETAFFKKSLVALTPALQSE